MIKNYIFDFGNVLGQFDPEAMTARYISDPKIAEAVCPVAYDRLYWDKLDDGSITDEEIRQDILRRLPQDLAEAAWYAYENWITAMPPVPGMEALVRDIKAAGGKVYLLSNISIGFAQNYHRCPWISDLFSLFDALVFSGPVGLVKPNKEIFDHLLSTYDLDPAQCIFIDDRKENIDGAAAAGIAGYLFDGNADALRKALGMGKG